MLYPMASKKASGRNVAENERGTVAVKLRLEPDAALDLAEFAERAHVTRASVVDAAMTMIYRMNEGDLSKKTGQQIYEEFLASIHR